MRVTGHRRHRPSDGPEAGFLLLETVVAIAIVTVVMTALTCLLVTTTRGTARQRGAQQADRMAASALDAAYALGANRAVRGRGAHSVDVQFASPLATQAPVADWLTSMTRVSDPSADRDAGSDAALPTTPTSQVTGGTTYEINYFVGTCWRPIATHASCVATSAAAGPKAAELVRVVAVLVWAADGCPARGCIYISAIVLSRATDPIFNFDQAPVPKPVLNPVATQLSDVGQLVIGLPNPPTGCVSPCPITATGGAAPLIFSGTVGRGRGHPVPLVTGGSCPVPDGSESSSPSDGGTATSSGPGIPSGTPPADASASYGFMLNPTCGLITALPLQPGTYKLSITVTDAFLSTSAVLNVTWKVKNAAPPTSSPTPTPTPGGNP